jgi:hypothetical protein
MLPPKMREGEGIPRLFGPSRPEALEDAIRRLPPGPLRPADYQVPGFELFSDWDIACHYAPFDHVEFSACVVVVAINPGTAQAASAFAAARDALWAGETWADAQRIAKQSAAFTGPLLTNLVRMLDSIELPQRLEEAGICSVSSSRALFARDRTELHATYCVRYPVIVDGRDYWGRHPVLLRSPLLRPFLYDVLEPELRALPRAVVVPLGRIAGEAVAALVEAGSVPIERCLFGLPHPSGTNGHREEDFERARDELSYQLKAWFGSVGQAAKRPQVSAQSTSLESR